MANKPYVCGDSDLTLPECSECDDLRDRLKTLEDLVDECCKEVRAKLDTHTEQIADIYDILEALQLKIESVVGLRTEIVEELPDEGEPNVIYLVENQGNTYDMWMYSDDEWVQVGGGIDLSSYVTVAQLNTAISDLVSTTQMNEALADKQDALTIGRGLRLNSGTLERVPLIGEITETDSNSAPNYYGTYTLVDKNYDAVLIENEKFIWMTSTSNRYSIVRRRGKTIQIKLMFDALLDDTQKRVCRITLDNLGLTTVPYQYFVGYNDVTHQIGQFKAYEEDGSMVIDCVDAVPHTGYSKETWYLQFDVMFGYSHMRNADCNKFYWKRTS